MKYEDLDSLRLMSAFELREHAIIVATDPEYSQEYKLAIMSILGEKDK